MSEIITMITTVGFPIVCCIGMAWYVKYTGDKYQAQIDSINATHSDEVHKITEALNNNTIALTKLCERMDRKETL